MIENENQVINILMKIDVLISMIDKLQNRIKSYKNNSEILDIEYVECTEIEKDTLNDLSIYIRENIERQNNIYNKLIEIEKTLESDFESIRDDLVNQIKKIEDIQSEKIYKKAIKLIYVARWQNSEKEKRYYMQKNSFLDKLIGKEKVNKLLLENKELESKIIKKEYYEIRNKYEGQSIRETVNLLNNCRNKNNAIIEFEEKIIKLFMVDVNTISTNVNEIWSVANLVPTGFFEKRKYYKILAKKIQEENKEMKEKLSTYIEAKADGENKIVDKFHNLIEMNQRLKNILNNI